MLDKTAEESASARDGLTRWERYHGGDAEAERRDFERFAKDILLVQHTVKTRARALRIDRAQHAKALLATDARLDVAGDLPPELAVGAWRPGASFPVVLRLSNASGAHQADGERDLRGAALRVDTGGAVQDLLTTNFPVPHARDARQFIAFAKAMAGSRLVGIPKLMVAVGPSEAVRMLRNVIGGSGRPVTSLAQESFWSRGAMLWGEAGPVRYFLRPAPDAPPGPQPATGNPNYLRDEIAARLARGAVSWELCVQRFVDERTTPVEDAAAEWAESAAPPVVVARLAVPRQDVFSPAAQARSAEIDALAFNPWNTTDDFRPLGNLNRARKAVYAASAAHRRGRRFVEPVPLRNRLSSGVASFAFAQVNRWRPWYRLPHLFALLNLAMLRQQLRRENLIDTEPREAPPAPTQPEPAPDEAERDRRSFDGAANDLSDPAMGRTGAAFGRNMPPDPRPELLHVPNPVDVSRELLRRRSFVPATSLNVLAAAWIQFQVHDWVQHARYPLGRRDVVVPMPAGRTWRNAPDGPEEGEMRFSGDLPLAGAGEDALVFGNTVSHWWDGSAVYGSDEAKARSLLDPPLLRLDPGGYLPEDMSGMELTGFNESWWLGLSAFHTLFAREHNAVCEALRHEYPAWEPMRVYHTARLVVSALIAKIHTVEWTPAILATPEIDVGLNANWSGPEGFFTRAGLWLTEAHALRGIPDTTPDHHAAPYSLTEDFVTVYRMHPLLPDDYRIHDARTGAFEEALAFDAIQGPRTDEVMRRVGLANVLYSMGIAHPGAITLHNYPRALQDFVRTNADGTVERIDLSVVDLMRERTRGIPRYNRFRQRLHKPPVTRWEDVTADPEDVRLLKEIYRSIDEIDTMVGLFAETPPVGFGFSDTAFRIFILMATRRLQSDRFLTVDFRPEIYSPLGIAWVQENTMTSIVLRHFPDFAGVLPVGESAFAPWRARGT